MQTLTTIIIPIILFAEWQYQANNEGWEEGLYYSAKSYNPMLNKLDEHVFWTVQRIIIASAFIAQYLTVQLIYSTSFLEAAIKIFVLGISYVLVFSFWHNGSLYITANKFSRNTPYPKGWKDSPNGKAKNDFTYNQRLLMFIGGWLLFITLILF